VLVKTKPATDRFSIHNATVTFRALDEVFSPDDIALITRFAEEMKLDWAAIDVLRDRASNRIYIVDVNKTDTGPAVDLSFGDREKLKAAIAAGFLELIAQRARIPAN
jgi:glutathione synthase/RimK-type ligase-like ATP-grasp enzyme